jgi:Glycosyl transferase family 2
MNPGDPLPTLSVVVALISGKTEDLASCLRALRDQLDPPSLEVLVPYDDPCSDVTRLAETYPDVHFLYAEGLDSATARAGSSREHHDTLRSIGLRAAQGRYVALTEDHATLGSRWCRTMVKLLEDHPQLAAIGGAVECGSDRILNRAVYYCDFGRYQNPIPEGPAEFVSDSNVVYRRDALDAIRDVWDGDYREHTVHLALVARGRPIWLTPRVAASQNRGAMTLAEAIRERYVWGRSFAGVRVEGTPVGRRLVYACLSPALPLILTSRLARKALSQPGRVGEFLAVLPHIALLNIAWAWGEFVGYMTGRPSDNTPASHLATVE